VFIYVVITNLLSNLGSNTVSGVTVDPSSEEYRLPALSWSFQDLGKVTPEKYLHFRILLLLLHISNITIVFSFVVKGHIFKQKYCAPLDGEAQLLIESLISSPFLSGKYHRFQ
jgi:hypothetical protein